MGYGETLGRQTSLAETSKLVGQFALMDDEGLANIFGMPEETSWQERALCAQTDPEAFFPEKNMPNREAKRVCAGCEVRKECLDYALKHDERFGVWGGLSERERRLLKKSMV